MRKKKILVQAGHVAPREPGHEDETGAGGEQDLVLQIRTELKILLARDPRFEGIYVPGDIPDGVRCDAALFLHADGSANSSASGFCFGYPEGYSVNKRLADLIADEFEKIPGHPPHGRDNYTGGLRHYYGYSRVDTQGPEVVIEHGFVSNPRERRWLFANADKLALAEYRALLRFFNMPPAGSPKPRKFAYRTEENDGDKQGQTDYPGVTISRIAKRLKKGERVIFERL